MLIQYILSLIFHQILTFHGEGHILVARIAELQLSKTAFGFKVLARANKILDPLRSYFLEIPNSILPASIQPDLLTG